MFRAACLEKMSGFDETMDTLEDHDFSLGMSTFSNFQYVGELVAVIVSMLA
jgi:hypothetical protein